ncbi:hypothetical protein TSHO111613_23200 [Tsukamurella hominis]
MFEATVWGTGELIRPDLRVTLTGGQAIAARSASRILKSKYREFVPAVAHAAANPSTPLVGERGTAVAVLGPSGHLHAVLAHLGTPDTPPPTVVAWEIDLEAHTIAFGPFPTFDEHSQATAIAGGIALPLHTVLERVQPDDAIGIAELIPQILAEADDDQVWGTSCTVDTRAADDDPPRWQPHHGYGRVFTQDGRKVLRGHVVDIGQAAHTHSTTHLLAGLWSGQPAHVGLVEATSATVLRWLNVGTSDIPWSATGQLADTLDGLPDLSADVANGIPFTYSARVKTSGQSLRVLIQPLKAGGDGTEPWLPAFAVFTPESVLGG